MSEDMGLSWYVKEFTQLPDSWLGISKIQIFSTKLERHQKQRGLKFIKLQVLNVKNNYSIPCLFSNQKSSTFLALLS